MFTSQLTTLLRKYGLVDLQPYVVTVTYEDTLIFSISSAGGRMKLFTNHEQIEILERWENPNGEFAILVVNSFTFVINYFRGNIDARPAVYPINKDDINIFYSRRNSFYVFVDMFSMLKADLQLLDIVISMDDDGTVRLLDESKSFLKLIVEDNFLLLAILGYKINLNEGQIFYINGLKVEYDPLNGSVRFSGVDKRFKNSYFLTHDGRGQIILIKEHQ